MIYEGSPAKHLDDLAAFVIPKLRENVRCLYLNSPAMVAGIRTYLAAAGLDVAQEVRKRSLVLSSDESHLIDGRFDTDRMLCMLEDALAQALADGYCGLWATGDMTWEFGNERNFAKLLEYEHALEKFLQAHPAMSGICQYHTDTLPLDVVNHGLSAHKAVYINRTLSRINPYYRAPGSAADEVSELSGVQPDEMLASPPPVEA